MKGSLQNVQNVVDRTVNNLLESPVGAWTGTEFEKGVERSYLQMLHGTYVRTVGDIVHHFAAAGRDLQTIRIIEFGLYLGVVSRALSQLGFQVTGAEFPELLDRQRLRASFAGTPVKLHAQDLQRPMDSLADQSFDCVVLCETLEHLNFNPLSALGEINRILAPGGLLYLAVPNIASLRNRLLLLAGRSIHNPIGDFFEQLRPDSLMSVGLHWREYTKAELEQMLVGLGFVIQEAKYFDVLGLATRSGLRRLLKSTVVRLLPTTASSIVVLATKAAYIDPRKAPKVGKTTLDSAG